MAVPFSASSTTWWPSQSATEKGFAVPFFQFIDRVMDIPVVCAVLVLAGCNFAEDRGDSGCGRPCGHQRQVPVVHRVRPEFISSSIHLQSVGLSCCATEMSTHSTTCAEDRRFHGIGGSWRLSTCPSLCNDRRRGAVCAQTMDFRCRSALTGGRCPC